VALLGLVWTVYAWLGPSWWQLAVAAFLAFLAVVFVQLGFLGHDAGHRQVFRSGRHNDVLGLLCVNLLIGLRTADGSRSTTATTPTQPRRPRRARNALRLATWRAAPSNSNIGKNRAAWCCAIHRPRLLRRARPAPW
jgi:hypothetical protein